MGGGEGKGGASDGGAMARSDSLAQRQQPLCAPLVDDLADGLVLVAALHSDGHGLEAAHSEVQGVARTSPCSFSTGDTFSL